jgi:hypothetical protein
MEHYLGVSEEVGLKEEEIGTVLSIVMAVSGGRVRAQFRDAYNRRRKEKAKAAST